MSNVKVPQAHMGRANAWDNLLVSEEDTYVRRAFNGLDNVPDPADNWGLAPHEDWVYERHNTKSGRCFMIGAGPSLSEQRDLLPLLQNEDTWTVNKFRMFKPPFTPTYHGV